MPTCGELCFQKGKRAARLSHLQPALVTGTQPSSIPSLRFLGFISFTCGINICLPWVAKLLLWK